MVRHTRTTRQRALGVAIAFALAAGTASVPTAHADDLKHKKSRVEHSIKGAQADLEESSNAAVHAQRRLAAARAELGTAQRRLADTQGRLSAARVLDARMQADLAQAREDLAAATTALEEGRAKVAEQRATLGRYAATTAQRADPRVLGLASMLQAQNPSDLAADMKTVGNVMNREDRVLQDLRDARSQLLVKQRQVQAAKDDVAAKAKAAADNLVLRRSLEEQALTDERSVADLVAARRGARRTAEAARRADQAELGKLKKENDRISAMLAARARRATNQGNGGTASNGGGALERPVTGYVTSAFGWRKHPIYGYWGLHDGTDFHAPCGTPLRAAGNGTVVSEYFNSAWGNRLILDLGRIRGHGVSVIYNHINSYKVGTGGHVSRGDTVAYAGTTGWSTACHLHFTVMVDGKAQDPMGWF